MRRTTIAVVSVAAVLLGAAAVAQQEVFPTPRAGTGVVTVTGAVDIERMPAVVIAAMPDAAVRQSGDWRVSVTGQPQVSLAPAAFVRVGVRYGVTWTDGSTETVSIAESGAGGWVRVQQPQGVSRWVNLSAARAIEEVR